MKKLTALVLVLACIFCLACCSSEENKVYTYEELSEMPADELLDLFIQNGLVISDDIKSFFSEEELQDLFKSNFHLWHQGICVHDYTEYIDLSEQTKVIYDKLTEEKN